MLKKIFKWASMPVGAMIAIVSFSAFTGAGETCGANHLNCNDGNDMHCYVRDCSVSYCTVKVNECKSGTWYNLDDCKK